MRARMSSFWQSLAGRQRTALAVLATLLAVAAYLWLAQAANRARLQLSASVSVLHAQASRLAHDTHELTRLRAAPLAPAAQTDLRAVVQTRIESAGLSRLVARFDAADSNQVQVEFGAVPFADWLGWIAALQTQQVRLESCRIDALSAPGLVSATATLVRARAQ